MVGQDRTCSKELRTQTEAFTGQLSQAFAAAKETARDHAWSLQTETANELEFRTSISIRSWGEKIKVRVDSSQISPNTLSVTVSSSARFQVSDWGKSADNISVLLTGLRQRLQGPTLSPSPMPMSTTVPANAGTKFCANCGARMASAMQFCTRCGQRAD